MAPREPTSFLDAMMVSKRLRAMSEPCQSPFGRGRRRGTWQKKELLCVCTRLVLNISFSSPAS